MIFPEYNLLLGEHKEWRYSRREWKLTELRNTKVDGTCEKNGISQTNKGWGGAVGNEEDTELAGLSEDLVVILQFTGGGFVN
jgi:hypothetical protein